MVLKKDSKRISELGIIEKRYKCISFGMIIIGVLILANVYWYLISWPVFIGGVFILTGILKLLMHNANLM